MQDQPKKQLRTYRGLESNTIVIQPRVHTTAITVAIDDSKEIPKHVKNKASVLMGSNSFTVRTNPKSSTCIIL
jgi:hypothetical protein